MYPSNMLRMLGILGCVRVLCARKVVEALRASGLIAITLRMQTAKALAGWASGTVRPLLIVQGVRADACMGTWLCASHKKF